jgi:hypothetical protein
MLNLMLLKNLCNTPLKILTHLFWKTNHFLQQLQSQEKNLLHKLLIVYINAFLTIKSHYLSLRLSIVKVNQNNLYKNEYQSVDSMLKVRILKRNLLYIWLMANTKLFMHL